MIVTVKGINITVGRDTDEVKAAAEFVHHLLYLDKQERRAVTSHWDFQRI